MRLLTWQIVAIGRCCSNLTMSTGRIAAAPHEAAKPLQLQGFPDRKFQFSPNCKVRSDYLAASGTVCSTPVLKLQ